MDLLNAYIHPDDVIFIKGLAISWSGRPDSNGWAFTDTGQYTVKLGYKIESKFPDKGLQVAPFGPDTNALLSYTWKLNCSPKLRHFVWQDNEGIIPVAKI